MSQITDKLAFDNDLCRRTTSVTRDAKRGQLIVVEEIRKNGKDESYRSEVYYHFTDDVETANVNAVIDMAKEIATYKFMGMEVGTTPVKLAVVKDMATPVEQTPEDAKELAKKAKAKVAATKRAAKKEAIAADQAAIKAKVQEPEAVYVAPVEEVVAPVTVEVKPIMFDKAEREHRSYLSPIIAAALGKDWKSEDENMSKVSELIGTLQGKIAVCDSTGAQLESFSDAVTQFLTL
jgi:hypothetical protein